MNKIYPDKYIRKAIYNKLNGIDVNGNTINCYDTRVVAPDYPEHYILMSTQLNSVDKNNKCEWFWESSILLDITTTYERQGNTGSRLLVDDICEAVRGLVNNLILDGGLSVVTQTQTYPNDITEVTDNEIVHRKFLRLELLIK